jgi:hypothetical protein
MKYLMKVNRQNKKQNGFENILNETDPLYFVYPTGTDYKHHKLSLDNFEYLDYHTFEVNKGTVSI